MAQRFSEHVATNKQITDDSSEFNNLDCLQQKHRNKVSKICVVPIVSLPNYCTCWVCASDHSYKGSANAVGLEKCR